MSYSPGVTEEKDVKTLISFCEGAIAPYTFVKIGSSDVQVIENDTANGFCLGVSGNASENGKNTYEDEDPIAVKYEGIVYVEMAGTGSMGSRVVSDATGKGVEHTTLDEVNVFGYALQAWTDGMVIPILVSRCFIGDTNPV